jgi:hypothetical protein
MLTGTATYDKKERDPTMSKTATIAISFVVFGVLTIAVHPCWGQATKTRKVVLDIKLPKAMFKGTPVPMNEPNIARGRAKGQARPVVKVPVGTVNLALKKKVTSNESLPVVGDLKMVTDGDKSGEDGHNVDIGFGKKWVQIDLGAPAPLSVIAIWHYHGQARAYRDVIVEVADDVDFTENVRIIYNTDHDNSYGKGIGPHMGWVETSEGNIIYCPKGTVARFVRLHSQGNTSNDQNHYVEVEVYGLGSGTTTTTKRPASYRGPLKIEYPKPMSQTTMPPKSEPNVASFRELGPGRGKAIIVSGDTTNLALNKPVTSNKPRPSTGKLSMVTDGDKSGQNGYNVDLGDGLKWVQIDLQAVSSISAISLWHYHTSSRVYRDVIVRVSNDPNFVKYVTIFNNDHDDSSGLGAGKDKGYVESAYGRLIGCAGTVGRYVRLYSKGSTADTNNHYVEVEVYGRPLKGMSIITKPAKTKVKLPPKGTLR